jgi:adhesin/invasin
MVGTASTLTVTVNGVQITTKPAVTVTAGSVSGGRSSVSFASNSVVSGSTDTVTIVAKDAMGNAVTGLTNASFAFSLSGGASSGTFGTVTETSTPGTYSTSFTGVLAGSASSLTATVTGIQLSSHPTVTVTAGPVNGGNSSAGFASPTVASGKTDAVTIVVKDAAGNAVGGLSGGAFVLTVSGGTSTGTFGSVSQTSTPGTYTATFTGALAGTATTLTVKVNSIQVSSQPKVTVTGGVPSGSKSTANFATSTIVSGSTDTATIVVKDAAGNAVSGLANSAFALTFSGGGSSGTFGTVTETGTPGTYTAVMTGVLAGSASHLTVKVSGVQLNSQPSVTVTPGGVSAATSSVKFASPTVASGKTDTVTITVKDAAGNAINGLTSSAFAFNLSGGTSTGTFAPLVMSSGSGVYTIVFTGVLAGTASTLTATVSGVQIATKPTVTVTAGAVSAANSTANFATPTVASGSTDTVTIVVKDAAGNAVTGLTSGAFGFGLGNGSSTGSFGTVTETSTPGTYTVAFTGKTAGTVSKLTVHVNGTQIVAQPTVTVTPGAVSGGNSNVQLASSSVAVGKTDKVTITVKDAAGNAITGLASAAFAFLLSGGTSAGTFGTVTETSTHGVYTVLFTGVTAGTTSTLTVHVNGVAITTQPKLTVTP